MYTGGYGGMSVATCGTMTTNPSLEKIDTQDLENISGGKKKHPPKQPLPDEPPPDGPFTGKKPNAR